MLHEAPEGYYDNVRPEIVALVPPESRFVVDVGCGTGGLGGALKSARPGIEVRGVEPVAAQAERARRLLDDVMVGGADDAFPASWPAPDCVIFADVLEHLLDPWRTVRRYREILPHGGALIVSIPNVAHRSVLRDLVRHRWDYRVEGILDRTHLRFFTRETAIEMLEGAGFAIRTVTRMMDGLGQKPLGRMLKRAIDRENGRDRVFPDPLAFVIDSFTYQYLVVAE